jgi:hypothetical protein
MAVTQTFEPGPLAPDEMDLKRAAELHKLCAKLKRLNKVAEQLGLGRPAASAPTRHCWRQR